MKIGNRRAQCRGRKPGTSGQIPAAFRQDGKISAPSIPGMERPMQDGLGRVCEMLRRRGGYLAPLRDQERVIRGSRVIRRACNSCIAPDMPWDTKRPNRRASYGFRILLSKAGLSSRFSTGSTCQADQRCVQQQSESWSVRRSAESKRGKQVAQRRHKS